MKKIISVFIIFVLMATSCFAYGVKVPVILYHNLAYEYDENDALLHITPERFFEHMQALKNAGYKTLSLNEYYKYLNGETDIPDNSVIVTFDDGYLSNYEYAYPILKELGMKAAIFVVTGTVGKTPGEYPHFNWKQAREMSDSGVIEIGTHTHSHDALTDLSTAQIRKEIRYSKYLVEKNMDMPCDYIAFPYGFWHDEVFGTAVDAGFKLQCMVGEEGYNEKSDGTVRPLKRITVSGNLTGEDLLNLLKENLSSY